MPRLAPVSCTLELSASSDRSGFDAEWRVLRADVAQRIDHPWVAIVTIVSDAVEVRVEELLGRSASLSWERAGTDVGPHVVHGLVTRAECLGIFDRQLHVRLRLEPALALLRLTKRRRIFEELSIPAIVARVLDPVITEHGVVLCTDGLREHHPVRDYCVQYDETDLELVCRLLGDAGIALVFDPTAATDHLRLTDENDALLPVEHVRGPTASDGASEIPLIAVRYEQAEGESIQALSATHVMTTARFVESAWDFKHRPPTRLRSDHETETDSTWGEQHEHARARLVELDRGDGATEDDTPAMARRCAERAAAESLELVGRSNVTGLVPGATFEVFGHPHDAFDGHRYLLTRVLHRIEVPSAAVGGADRSSSYHNELSCVPLDRPYRPRRQPPPRAWGPETARVVGPQPDEVHTDRHGRVRVRMHWDERDEQASSCWLRVGQAWAGAGFGTLFLPRVGMEVIVSFLGGNPDRPIVTGCVYDAANVPPVDLPEHRTQSTIRTSSSPGGRGHNELRFEDGAGHEEVFLRAQRNLRERVLADHLTTVGRDQSLHVGRNRSTTIDGDHSSTIAGENRHTVGGGEYRHIHGGRSIGVSHNDHKWVGENLELYVNGSKYPETPPFERVDGAKIHVGGDSHFEATRTHTLLCGESRIHLTPGTIELEAPEAIALTVGGTRLELSSRGLGVISEEITLVAGASGDPGGHPRLLLAADVAELASPGKASVTGRAASVVLRDDAEIQGCNVSINGVDTTEIGGTTINVDAETAVKVAGKMLEWAGDLVEINGD